MKDEHADFMVPALLIGFVVGLVIGALAGSLIQRYEWCRETVRRGYAEHDQFTGHWQWKEKAP